MAIEDYLKFGNVISFDVYPGSIIGTTFEDVQVRGLLDRDDAAVHIDPEAQHINVYPTLPAGVPDDPRQYQFVKVAHMNGEVSVIGVPWIREDTVVVSERGTLTLTVANVTPEDKNRIINALASNGYRTQSVSLK